MKPISRTAFYCCGIRMEDAESERPICGDVHARKFMGDEGLRVFAEFKGLPGPKATNVTRHRIVDDLLRRKLTADPRLMVVLVGAGFDSRAYRLRGGSWVELDEPQIIAHKDGRLSPSGCPNPLQRIPIDFSAESLEDKLAPFADREPPVVVVEGVLMYLEEPQILELIRCLRSVFPRHELICDLMSREFLEKFGKPVHDRIAGLGATFRYLVDDPQALFRQAGYRLEDRISIGERAVELGAIPARVFEEEPAVRKKFIEGYSIDQFELG